MEALFGKNWKKTVQEFNKTNKTDECTVWLNILLVIYMKIRNTRKIPGSLTTYCPSVRLVHSVTLVSTEHGMRSELRSVL